MWSKATIDAECREAYGKYEKRLDAHYSSYLHDHPELAGEHPKKVKDIAAALPPGMDFLANEIPPAELHTHHLSAKSSQLLALGLLGAATKADPSMGWLLDACDVPLPPMSSTTVPETWFEHNVGRQLLNEKPRQTAIDLLIRDDQAVIACEAKWAEKGLGACSCDRSAIAVAACKPAILDDRPKYWEAAGEDLDLPDRQAGSPCPISAAYQAVRNVAAARALSEGKREAAFVLLYDDRNPYFVGAGSWLGWPTELKAAMDKAGGPVRFGAISWQTIVKTAPLSDAVKKWALNKHQLESN